MCTTCGCDGGGQFSIQPVGQSHAAPAHHHHHHGENEHHHHHHHQHDDEHHTHDHQHHHHEHQHAAPQQRQLQLEIDILAANDKLAERNRGYFEAKGIMAINLVSSPGSGKTTVLEKTLLRLQQPAYVIEGDQQTNNDADRIAATGAPVVQINTGQGCHLDALMINKAVKQLQPASGGILFIENVGNLVCPAMFDLGEHLRVVVASVTEGEDKPVKYPDMFRSSQLCLINKTDLLPYVPFNVDRFMEYARQVNPQLQFIAVSAWKEEGIDTWLHWLEHARLHALHIPH